MSYIVCLNGIPIPIAFAVWISALPWMMNGKLFFIESPVRRLIITSSLCGKLFSKNLTFSGDQSQWLTRNLLYSINARFANIASKIRLFIEKCVIFNGWSSTVHTVNLNYEWLRARAAGNENFQLVFTTTSVHLPIWNDRRRNIANLGKTLYEKTALNDVRICIQFTLFPNIFAYILH